MSKSGLIEAMRWRYATKKMDPKKVVPEDKLAQIIEAIRLTPTSSGAQPFEVFVVTNDETRAKIRAVSWDQSPVTDGSHLLVFAAWDNYTAERIDAVKDQMVAERGEIPSLISYYEKLKATYLPKSAEENHEHAARQAYIALGFAMLAAADLEVDCTPMEGFEPDKVDAILGLDNLGLRAVALLPLGYRDPDGDWLLPMKKVRKPLDAFVTEIA